MTNSRLHIREPWTMPPLDTVDIFIDALHRQISSKHPLYRRAVFPIALRRDPDAVIYETDDAPWLYALVLLSWSSHKVGRKRGKDPQTVILKDWQAIQARMDLDNMARLT